MRGYAQKMCVLLGLTGSTLCVFLILGLVSPEMRATVMIEATLLPCFSGLIAAVLAQKKE